MSQNVELTGNGGQTLVTTFCQGRESLSDPMKVNNAHSADVFTKYKVTELDLYSDLNLKIVQIFLWIYDNELRSWFKPFKKYLNVKLVKGFFLFYGPDFFYNVHLYYQQICRNA